MIVSLFGVFKLLRSAAEQRGIDQALVATRAEVKALLTAGAAARPEDHRLLRGWRLKFVGRDLAGLPERYRPL